MVGALPVLLANPECDWKSYSTDPLSRNETSVGMDFMTANGPRALWLYTLGRCACIPFSIVGAWVCYRWARDIYGIPSGLMAIALWSFSPSILGNAPLMMPDVPAAALGALASYTFWRWLSNPTWVRSATAAITLGIAELTKATLVIFFVLWPLLWLAYRLTDSHRRHVREWLREAGMLLTCMLIALYVLNLGYGFEGSFLPLGDYRFQSDALTGHASENRQHSPGNRFVSTPLASLMVPLPRNYLQGVDQQKVDFEAGMRSFLHGAWSHHGWWYFYLYALTIKLPLGTIVLAGAAAAVSIGSYPYKTSPRDDMIVLIPLVVILAFVSSQTGFSIHSRYALPLLPFFFVWASKSAMVFQGTLRGLSFCSAALLVWAIGSSLWCYPHCLSYFNEIVGGPEHGHEHLLDSNVAWGQDLWYLKEWYNEHPEARPLRAALFSIVDPRLTGIEFTVPPLGPSAQDSISGGHQHSLGPQPGWYAIDVNYLHGCDRAMPDGKGGLALTRLNDRDLAYFRMFPAVTTVGYSIRIFFISHEQANVVRHRLNLPPLDAEFRNRVMSD